MFITCGEKTRPKKKHFGLKQFSPACTFTRRIRQEELRRFPKCFTAPRTNAVELVEFWKNINNQNVRAKGLKKSQAFFRRKENGKQKDSSTSFIYKKKSRLATASVFIHFNDL